VRRARRPAPRRTPRRVLLLALVAPLAACNGDNGPAGPEGDRRLVAVAAGEAHSCALRASGEAYCWGLDDHGQLGASATATCPFGGTKTPTRAHPP
jgi:alpha-tubulin suppressor-like RCC1 family protein